MQLIGENEELSVSHEAKLLLLMVKEMTKINVKELARLLLNQVVTRMSISDTKDVSGNTLPSE